MSEYKIEDLRGKYAKVGTPECEAFVEKCLSAAEKYRADCDVTFSEAIFDALKNGDIKAPEVEK